MAVCLWNPITTLSHINKETQFLLQRTWKITKLQFLKEGCAIQSIVSEARIYYSQMKIYAEPLEKLILYYIGKRIEKVN